MNEFKKGRAIVGIDSVAGEDYKHEQFVKALNIVRERIGRDPDLQQSYEANIAMSFLDCHHSYRVNHNKKYLNRNDLHKIANIAAKNFMDLWLKL